MATISDISRGSFVRIDGELLQVIEFQHRTPGNLRAFYQVKMRNVKNGKLAENRYRPSDSVEIVRVEVKEYVFSYKDGSNYVCMNNETYEQIYVNAESFGDAVRFLKEETIVKISLDENETPISAELPLSVVLEVTYAEPGIRGDTANKTLKPATLETGAQISIPLFVEIGEKIRVNTETGDYMERVK